MNKSESIKAVRRNARVTVAEASGMASVSPTTWRLFEANTEAVTEAVRARCEGAVERMRGIAKAHEAA